MDIWLVITVLGAMFLSTTATQSETNCNCKTPNRLVLTYNPATQIQVAVNDTADTVPVLDYNHNISSLYNGKTGAALAFNYETGIAVFIPPGSDITWNSSSKSFQNYFANLPSQLELYHYGEIHGVRFDPSSVTDDISDAMVDILAPLSQEYSSRCEALATFLHVCKITSDYFKSSMVAFPDVMGNVETPFRGDFKWLVGIYQGIGAFFQVVPGGMSTLAEKNVTLDMGKIMTEPSGIHVLVYLMKELSPHFDVGNMLGDTLNNPLAFFDLIDKLGGEMSYGFDGYVHVVAEIVRFYSNSSSISNVEIVVEQYGNHPITNSTEVAQQWKTAIQDLSQAVNKLGLNQSLQNFTQVLSGISNGTWTLNNVEMTPILEAVVQIDPGSDQTLLTEVKNLIQRNEQASGHN